MPGVACVAWSTVSTGLVRETGIVRAAGGRAEDGHTEALFKLHTEEAGRQAGRQAGRPAGRQAGRQAGSSRQQQQLSRSKQDRQRQQQHQPGRSRRGR